MLLFPRHTGIMGKQGFDPLLSILKRQLFILNVKRTELLTTHTSFSFLLPAENPKMILKYPLSQLYPWRIGSKDCFLGTGQLDPPVNSEAVYTKQKNKFLSFWQTNCLEAVKQALGVLSHFVSIYLLHNSCWNRL